MRRGYILLAVLVAAGASADAQGQCYQFSGGGTTLQINVSTINLQMGPTSASGFVITNYNFSGNNSLTTGGATLTSQSVFDGGVYMDYSSAMAGELASTTFQIIVPSNQMGVTWEALLIGNGDLIPAHTLPQTLPAISAWMFQSGNNPPNLNDYIQVNPPAGPKYTITSISNCGSGSGTPPPTTGATSPLQDLGDPSSLPGDCGCGEPINVGTGNVYYEAADYHTTGTNQLGFTRYYNSLAGASGSTFATALGTNWRSNYDRYLRLSSSSSVIAERANGQQVTFTLSGSTWTTDTDIDLALTNTGSTWTLTDHQDNVETYTNSGANEAVLQTIKARNGYTQTMHYNGIGQLTSVTDSFNRQLTLANSSGLLQSVITPDGTTLLYGYTAGVLTSVGYSTTPATSQTYVYGNSAFPAALTAIVDENGATYISWTYDSQGRALTGQFAGGAGLTTIVYNDTDGSRTVTNALGETDLYKFTTLQSVPKVTEVDRQASSTTAAATASYTYDGNGYTASYTDFNGNVTASVNDAHGQPTTINEAVGTPQTRTTTVTYLSSLHLPSQIVTPGLTASFTYDNNGELLSKTLTDTTTGGTPYSTAGQTRTWTYTWSNFLMTSVKTPRTDVSGLSKVTYDASGALTAVTNALNQTFQVAKHLGGGLPETTVDPNGVTVNLSYDARQRLLSTATTTSAGILTTSYAYDAAGNPVSVTSPDGSALALSYDAAHRLTAIADLFKQQVSFTLDGLGDRMKTVWSDASGVTQRTRAANFDPLGRLLQDIGGANQTTTYAYDANGNVLTAIDPLNRKTQRTFDALNRLASSVDAADGTTAESYDAHNRPLSVADPNGATTAYVYDGFGDVIQEVSPSRGATVYKYDLDGNLVQEVDARGVIANYAYDALDRVVSVTYPGGSGENVTYNYDQSGHGFGIGRLTSVSDAAGTLSRNYDERGNELSEARVNGSATLLTSYTYDAASRVASITYPSGAAVTYARDKMGRITAASLKQGSGASQAVVSAVSYEPFGPVTALTYGNGISETRSFDQDFRMTKLAGGPVENLTYGYDTANNVLSIADGVTSGNSQNLSYDVLNRLASAAGGAGSLGYTYDGNGNRKTESAPPSTLDGLSAVTGFSYNQAGRLAAATQGSQQVAQYSYDAFGQRLVKQAAVTTIYLYDQQGRLLEESAGPGGALSDYIYLDGRPIATIAQSTGGQLYFLHDDRLGTPQVATDKSQKTVWAASYQPFGGLNAAASQTATLAQDLRLPGQIMDAETGLYANGFRSYAPGWGRYTQSDPLGLTGGLNTYGYALGNPFSYSDPWGLCTVSEAISAALAAASQAETSVENSIQNQLTFEQEYGFNQWAQQIPGVPWAENQWQQYGPTAIELNKLYGDINELKEALEGEFGSILGFENKLLELVVGPLPTYTWNPATGQYDITPAKK